MARDQGVHSRRRFCWTLAGVLVAPHIAIAQVPKVRRIGVLEAGAADSPEDIRKQDEPLRQLGWLEGRNLHVERRYANGRLERLQALAEELVRANVEVIVANGPNPTRAAMRATTTIPIVFRVGSDAVMSGLVASLARPGGNVTGFSVATPEVDAKLLSLLKELLPTYRRIGMLETVGNQQFSLLRKSFEESCRLLDLEPVFVEISAAAEIDGAISLLVTQRAQALVLRDDSFAGAHGRQIIETALKRNVPTISGGSNSVREAGALGSYSATDAEVDRRAAYYIDRILRGAKPADLPVEQPTQFWMALNLKTAKALGITIPQSLLLRADEVIQ